ncbi:MAG TPA: ribonuclease III [Nitrospiraceae bacterium]|nr:ribonuclease III [Nitrospiraceae bacterium]
MTSVSSAEALQATLGYRFQDQALLDEALTHKSYVNEQKGVACQDNERLEFLGDAVLSLVISEYLASRLPESTEGALSKLKAQLVSESSLERVARRLQLGGYLKLGRGEELSRGREKSSLLADAVEAILAAVYLDGGFEASRRVTLHIFAAEVSQVGLRGHNAGAEDYKTQFQEWCQKRHDTLPRYKTIRESGPDHDKCFDVEVTILGEVVGVGSGRSKKEAEQQAAKQALERVMM